MDSGALRRGRGGPVLRERFREGAATAAGGAEADQEAAPARATAPQRVHAPLHAPTRTRAAHRVSYGFTSLTMKARARPTKLESKV